MLTETNTWFIKGLPLTRTFSTRAGSRRERCGGRGPPLHSIPRPVGLPPRRRRLQSYPAEFT